MNELTAFILSGGVLSGIIVFVVKSLISKSIDAGVMNYKFRLNKELDAHKHNLDLLKIQYQIQFSSLNEKRGEFIAKLYSEMYVLEQKIQNYTSVIQQNWTEFGESYTQVEQQLKKVTFLFEANRIYLAEDLCATIESNLGMVKQMIFEMSKAKKMGEAIGKTMVSVDFPEGKSPVEIWSEQDQKARKDIVKNRKLLAEQFRQLLGVLPENNR
jgi:hypothetical protein